MSDDNHKNILDTLQDWPWPADLTSKKREEDLLLRKFVYQDSRLMREFQAFKAMEMIRGNFSD